MATPAASAQPRGDVALHLISQPFFYREGDRLDLALRIANNSGEDLRGFSIRVSVYDRVGSRSELEDSFGGLEGAAPHGLSTKDYPSTTIRSAATTRVLLRQPVTESLPLQLGDSGVYPVTLSLYDTSLNLLDDLTTQLIYYPNDPSARVGMAMVVPLGTWPSRSPDGVFRPDPTTGEQPLEQALIGSGWLQGLVDGMLDTPRRFPVAVAPVPRLIEEVADMAGGFRRAGTDGEVRTLSRDSEQARAAAHLIASIRTLLRRRDVQRILTPYSYADLPAVTRHLGSAALTRQISIGRSALESDLGVSFNDRWLLPPAGRLDAVTLEQLTPTGASKRTFFSSSSLQQSPEEIPPGCPSGSPSYTCPVAVDTEAGTSVGYRLDSELQQRLVDLGHRRDKRLELQRVLSETAAIQSELPSRNGRVVTAVLPALWHPAPSVSRLLFDAFATAPWLKPLTPSQGLTFGAPIHSERIVDEADVVAGEPDAAYYDRLLAADSVIDSYRSIGAPVDRVQRLRRDVLVGESRAWWVDSTHLTGGDFAAQAQSEASHELAKIRIIGRSGVTLSSRRGPIPIVVSNNTGYPVTVDITLTSSKLTIQNQQNLLDARLDQGTRQITIHATARSSGTFPLDVSISTPDGRPIASERIVVRSTELNRIALGITIGAFAFLIVFYVWRLLRRRRRAREQTGATAA